MERSDTSILGNLGILVHFRHFKFIWKKDCIPDLGDANGNGEIP
jgi:hypothetical protein